MLRKFSLITALIATLVLPADAFAARMSVGPGAGRMSVRPGASRMSVGHGAGVWHFHSGGPTGGGAWHWHRRGYRGYTNYWGGYDDSSCWGWDPYSNQWVWICD